jgi:hypothetical protein
MFQTQSPASSAIAKGMKLLRGMAGAKVALLRAIHLEILSNRQSDPNYPFVVIRTGFLSCLFGFERANSSQNAKQFVILVYGIPSLHVHANEETQRLGTRPGAATYMNFMASERATTRFYWTRRNTAPSSKPFIHTTMLRGLWRAIVRDRME